MLHKNILWMLQALLLIFMVQSCSINETEKPEEGVLYITAIDTTNNSAISGANIYVDEKAKDVVTPAYIKNLEVGQYEVTIRPPVGWPAQTKELTVIALDTTSYEFRYGEIDTLEDSNQSVTLKTNQSEVTYMIDDQIQGVFDDSVKFILTPNSEIYYNISIYKSGFKTLLPSIHSLLAEEGGNTTLTLDLEAKNTGSTIGSLAPDFKLPKFGGLEDPWSDSLSLGQFRGRVVLVNFWFATCRPCRDEFPHFEEAYNIAYSDGFRILAINTGWENDDAEDFEEFGNQYNFPLLNNNNTDRVDNLYNINYQAPQNFIVDKTGVIRYQMGATNYEELMVIIDELTVE